MKLKVLLDNNTLIDEKYMLGEAGVSYLIEDGDTKILFDTGYSDAYIKNATAMGENLLDIDFIVWSHGHLDHTWGLHEYIKKYNRAETMGESFSRPKFLAHPLSFMYKRYGKTEIGPLLSKDVISRHFKVISQKAPYWFGDDLVWLGEIERKNDFENQTPVGKVMTPKGKEVDDYLMEDSAFAYKSDKGLVVISACSHPGICNIIEYAKKLQELIRSMMLLEAFTY